MNFNSIHVLLTYQCNYECDHCFVWGSPQQAGAFTWEKLEEVFQQALQVATVGEFYFEGGESFLYYPILVRAVARATELGFATGIVTNGYWANSLTDSLLWLRPLAEAGLGKIEISCDLFHGNAEPAVENHPGLLAAGLLGLKASNISLSPPSSYRDPESTTPGEAIAGGDVMYRGRAAHNLTAGLPRQPWHSFTRCPYEDLVDPGRVHLDPYGNLHICQGLVIGNLFQRPLIQIVSDYDPATHPIVSLLQSGGPTHLVCAFDLAHEDGYVDACHLCYSAREQLRPEFADILTPDQMYGVMGAV